MSMKTKYAITRFAALAFAVGGSLFVVPASAEDAMKPESTKPDTMKADHMKPDAISLTPCTPTA